MASMYDVLGRIVESDDFPSVDRVEIPARSERSVAIPADFQSGSTGRWLMHDPKLQGKLWLHQAKAMEAAAKGRNVVVATGTASGKSLVFQSAALRTLDGDDEAAVIVFYPLKALATDQLDSWHWIAEQAGFNRDVIEKVDGSIPRGERAGKLRKARIVLMTPDVCHAWLLREVSGAAIREFISRTALVIIDEAHVLEGVFGSNFAYLFRRLSVVRAHARRTKRSRVPLQVIAASATIHEPDKHLEALTGLQYETVHDVDDGSPRHVQSIVHIGISTAKPIHECSTMLRRLVSESDTGSCITFVDSRQGAERIAVQTSRPDEVKPYRSGYEADDRTAIEQALRQGRLRGVVSTSALELGIDIPHFAVGLNVRVPSSRKSFRQRVGRVGRTGPGMFGIVAPPFAFKRFGMKLSDYYQASIEPSYLYLYNRFIQYAHARCLAEELEMLGFSGRKTLPSGISWPDGFSTVFDCAYAGGPADRPREFDQINNIGGDEPHFNYPLRNIVEETFTVGKGGPSGSISRIDQLSLQQAIREAFPGAVYLSQARGWLVHEWKNTAFERTIRVRSASPYHSVKPYIRTFANFSLDRDSIVERHIRKRNGNVFAECRVQITERVEGFRDGDKLNLYKELRQSRPGMTTKTRDFRTTGVVLRVDELWFRETGIKHRVAGALRDLMLREYSISPNDIGAVATNVSEVRNGRLDHMNDTVVVFDATHGSLRLTEPAFIRFDHLLNRLARSAEMTDANDRLLSLETVDRLRQWFERLESESEADLDVSVEGESAVLDGGWIHVFEVGSLVAHRDTKGILQDIQITGYELMQMDHGPQLVYTYEGNDYTGLVPAERVEQVGHDWNRVYWNPKTKESRESVDDPTE